MSQIRWRFWNSRIWNEFKSIEIEDLEIEFWNWIFFFKFKVEFENQKLELNLEVKRLNFKLKIEELKKLKFEIENVIEWRELILKIKLKLHEIGNEIRKG